LPADLAASKAWVWYWAKLPTGKQSAHKSSSSPETQRSFERRTTGRRFLNPGKFIDIYWQVTVAEAFARPLFKESLSWTLGLKVPVV
jgi:hypothetical protein